MSSHDWTPDRSEVERLAYRYWEERGCLHGCHDEDWYRAEQEIRRARGEAPPERTVLGIFHSPSEAKQAYHELRDAGFSQDEIGFIAHTEAGDPDARAAVAATPDRSAEVAADAGIGAALGGAGGLLLGFSALAVPGIGPVLAAGPIIAALGGAGLGAAAGGLIGALTDRGVPEEDAGYYAEGVRRGDILITVHASGERATEAGEILDRNGAVDINDRVSSWRERGWTGYDGSAPPLTSEELRRERNYRTAAESTAIHSGRNEILP